MAINNTSIYEECLKAMARQKIALDVSKYLSLFFIKWNFASCVEWIFLLLTCHNLILYARPYGFGFFQVNLSFKHFTISKEF